MLAIQLGDITSKIMPSDVR